MVPDPGRPQPQLGRVFVSSVFREMLDVRRRVEEAARGLGFRPVMTEHLVAQPGDVASAIDREIRNCATYVGLFSKQRGTVPGGEQWAITEQEFLMAGRYGLRRLVFLDQSAETERDEGLRRFLVEYVHPFRGGVYPMPYATEDELRLGITSAMSALRPEVVLSIEPRNAGLAARLFVSAMQPALGGDQDQIGPFAFGLELSADAARIVGTFLADAQKRGALGDDALKLVGAELCGKLAEAREVFAQCLSLCAQAGLPLLLRVRSRESAALALPWELIHLPKFPLPVRQGLLEVVRHIPPENADPDPRHDPAPRLPASEFAVLGFTSDPLEDEAADVGLGPLGIVGSRKLFWEVEQERILIALDPVLSENRGRLVLPDTGDRAVLAEELARDTRPTIIHLSGHGGPKEVDGRPRQAIHLEDEDGHRTAATSENLLGWIRARADLQPPSLVVLSACHTASGLVSRTLSAGGKQRGGDAGNDGLARSLAEDLVRGGLLRVLGMQTSISDAGATEFAAAFYAALARGADLVIALREGRAALRDRGDAHEWAIPILLTQDHLGPLVAPPNERRYTETPLERTRGAFAIGNVTYLEHGYVGRRIFDRRLHRAWREGARLIAIQGFGGIGKSTVAARFLERRASEGVRVLVFPPGRRLAGTLLDDVAALVGVRRPDEKDAARAEETFRAELTKELRRIPTALLLDNFEHNQDPATHNLDDRALDGALADLAVLGGPALRLLFTTRYDLTLAPGPVSVRNLDLGELSGAEALKLRVLLGLKVSDADWRKIIESLGGHPKALEILAGYLRENTDRLRSLLRRFDRALEHVTAALAAERQERGRQLLIDTVLDELPASRLPALDRLCLLSGPLPTDELVGLLRSDGVADAEDDVGWLRAQGLLAQTASASAIEGGDAVHRLIASRRGTALAGREGEDAVRAFHRKASIHLVKPGRPASVLGLAAAHLNAAGDRAGALALWDRWVLTLRDAHAYRAGELVASRALAEMPPEETDACRISAAHLHLGRFDCLFPLGALEAADTALKVAERLLSGLASPEAIFVTACVELRRGERYIDRGDPKRSLLAYQAAYAGFEKAGRTRDAAIALGGQARLKAAAGDVQDAMALRQKQLVVFQQLGAVHDRAVTLGEIARLKADAGDVRGALTLYHEQVTVFQQLGAVRDRAVSLGDIAALKERAGDVQGAMAFHEERLVIFNQLGHVRYRAMTLGEIARLKAGLGDVEGAMTLYEEILAVFQQLGDVHARAVTLGGIARLKARSGDVQGALALYEQELAVYQQVGDLHSRAVTLGDIARLKTKASDTQSAMTLHEERLRIFEQLGEVRERALTLGDIARIKAQAGSVAEARRLHDERLHVMRRIGDIDGIAAALSDLAQLDLAQQDAVQAASKLAEAWRHVVGLNKVEAIAVVGEQYGRILADLKDARAVGVLEECRRACATLGDAVRAREISVLIERLIQTGR